MKLTFWVHKYNQDKEKLIQQHLFGSSIQPGEKKGGNTNSTCIHLWCSYWKIKIKLYYPHNNSTYLVLSSVTSLYSCQP